MIKVSEPFLIPEFQRPYSWGKFTVSQLLQDIENAVNTQKKHFFGSIVLVKQDNGNLVIDGQQRLTTCYLFVAAIYNLLKQREILHKDSKFSLQDCQQNYSQKNIKYSAEQINSLVLYAEFGKQFDHRNIALRAIGEDDIVFSSIVKGNENELTKEQKQNKLYKSYKQIYSYLNRSTDFDKYFDSLDTLEIIKIIIGQGDDNPQKIFESINTTGEPTNPLLHNNQTAV